MSEIDIVSILSSFSLLEHTPDENSIARLVREVIERAPDFSFKSLASISTSSTMLEIDDEIMFG